MSATPPGDAIEQIVGPAAQTQSPDGGSFVDYESPSFAESPGAAAAGRSPAKKRIVKKSQSQNWQIPAVAIGVGLLLVVALVIWAANNQGDEEAKQQKKAEEAHKAQVEEERVIPYHAPKPKPTPSPSHAERTPRIRTCRRRTSCRRRRRSGRTSPFRRMGPNPKASR